MFSVISHTKKGRLACGGVGGALIGLSAFGTSCDCVLPYQMDDSEEEGLEPGWKSHDDIVKGRKFPSLVKEVRVLLADSGLTEHKYL